MLSNVGTILMAIVLAIIVWGYLYWESTGVQEFGSKLNFEGIDPDEIAWCEVKDIAGIKIHDSIKLEITGPKSVIRTIAKRQVSCVYKFNPADFAQEHGTLQFELKDDNFDLPAGVRLQIKPGSKFQIEYKKFVPTYVTLTASSASCKGEPAKGYRVSKVYVSPDRVKALIPATTPVPEKIVYEGFIDVTGRIESFSVPFEAQTDLPAQTAIKIVEKAEVRVMIEAKATEKLFTKVPVRVTHMSGTVIKITVDSPNECDVLIEGKEEVVAKLKDYDILLFVVFDRDPKAFKDQEQNINLKVNAKINISEDERSQIQVKEIRPAEVIVKIKYLGD